MSESEGRLRAEIAAAEKRAIEHASQEAAKITVRMDATDKHRTDQFKAVNDRFGDVNMRLNLNFTLLVVLIGVVIGLPLLRERKKGARAGRETRGTTKATGGTTAANRGTRA